MAAWNAHGIQAGSGAGLRRYVRGLRMADDRQWLVRHLNDQARQLQTLTMEALRDPEDASTLIAVRDEVFTMRETLDTLGVPHALVTNAEWNVAIGTEFVE
jgi:primase-polymerase (primpol)-like protein